MRRGGRFAPLSCRASTRLALIVPYRRRDRHLKILLQNIHHILQRQQLEYGIYIIEQVKIKLIIMTCIEWTSTFDNSQCLNVNWIFDTKVFLHMFQRGLQRFNRGILMNIGFLEALKEHDWNCFVFHDVDHLPQLYTNPYDCQITPRHVTVGKPDKNIGIRTIRFTEIAFYFSHGQIQLHHAIRGLYWRRHRAQT